MSGPQHSPGPGAPSPAADTADDNRYSVDSRLEISQILHGLARRATLITACPDGSREFFLTAIVAIEDETGCLWLDTAPGRQQVERALAAASLKCAGTLEKVQIEFTCEAVEAGTFEGRPALRAALPRELTRLQRREHFRIETPVAVPLKCRLSATRDGRPEIVDLTLADISCGGINLITPPGGFEPVPGARYPCTISLPGAGALNLTLVAQHTRIVTTHNGKQTRRSGFAFVAPPPQALATIQRYIMQLERERRAKFIGG